MGSAFSNNKYQFNLTMRQETAMGVLPRLKRRIASVVGQNTLFFENTYSVITLTSYLFSDLSVIFVDNLFPLTEGCFLN